ncbi:hypothetical protein ACFROC_00600 [Nocardia tengchongensis]|uniref:hypothetical protein n=1 Tax=Nocardia tengchongensis TaxID=2055889 RepID=UPI0036A4C634
MEKEAYVRHGRPSKEQLELTLARVLASVLEGHGVRTETGLDRPTRTALTAIAHAHPSATEELVEAALRSFSGQLDGGNAARSREESDRKLRQRAAEMKFPN